MVDPSVWAWPQWAEVGSALFCLGIYAAKHGDPKVRADGSPQTWSFWLGGIATAINIWILVAGGFFGGHHG